MAVAGIKVNTQEVVKVRNKLNGDGEDIIARLNEVKASMDALSGTEIWDSDAGKAIQRKFSELYPKFASMKRVIDDYVLKLDEIKSKYETTEEAVLQDVKSVNDWA